MGLGDLFKAPQFNAPGQAPSNAPGQPRQAPRQQGGTKVVQQTRKRAGGAINIPTAQPQPQKKEPEGGKSNDVFLEKINKMEGIKTYMRGLAFCMKILKTFPETMTGGNPVALDVMGFDRNQIVELLQRILGNPALNPELADYVEDLEPMENYGGMTGYLQSKVFKLNEESSTEIIIKKLQAFKKACEQYRKSFFYKPHMQQCFGIIRDIEEGKVDKGDDDAVRDHCRNKLGLVGEDIPKMDILS